MKTFRSLWLDIHIWSIVQSTIALPLFKKFPPFMRRSVYLCIVETCLCTCTFNDICTFALTLCTVCVLTVASH